MRGRTFLNRYIIIDEAQNLTPKQIKNAGYSRRPWEQNHLLRGHQANRYPLFDRSHFGFNICSRSF